MDAGTRELHQVSTVSHTLSYMAGEQLWFTKDPGQGHDKLDMVQRSTCQITC